MNVRVNRVISLLDPVSVDKSSQTSINRVSSAMFTASAKLVRNRGLIKQNRVMSP